MPIPELVGSKEASQLLGIGPTNFSHLRTKMQAAGDTSFPAPIQQLASGPIWTKSSMEKFKKHYDSRRRRVRSTNGDTAATVEPVKAPAKKVAAKKTAAAKKAPAKKVAAKKAPAKKAGALKLVGAAS